MSDGFKQLKGVLKNFLPVVDPSGKGLLLCGFDKLLLLDNHIVRCFYNQLINKGFKPFLSSHSSFPQDEDIPEKAIIRDDPPRT